MRTLLALALLLPLALQPARAEDGRWEQFEGSQSEFEAAYGTKAEAISPDAAEELLLELVNEARSQRGLSAVEPDASAHRLAAKHSAEMASKGHGNHENLAGEKCELRFKRLGETDYVWENVFYTEINRPIYLTERAVRHVFKSWMDSPGHRRNILDPAHTHLGASFALGRGTERWRLAAVQEFVNDYGELDLLPLEMPRGARFELSGRLRNAELLAVLVGREELPQARSVAELRRRPSQYSMPAPLIAYLPREHGIIPLELPEAVFERLDYEARSGDFGTFIEFGKHWQPGACYITVWAADAQGRAFCAMCDVVLVRD